MRPRSPGDRAVKLSLNFLSILPSSQEPSPELEDEEMIARVMATNDILELLAMLELSFPVVLPSDSDASSATEIECT